MPEALLATMPPTMQLPIEAGSGPNRRSYRASIRLTRAPTRPGWRVMLSSSGWKVHFSQFFPATSSTLSERAWPDRLVPAARKVTERPSAKHRRSTSATSSSDSLRTTSCGTM